MARKRTRLGLTQYQAAARIGIGHATYQKAETFGGMGDWTERRIARWLKRNSKKSPQQTADQQSK